MKLRYLLILIIIAVSIPTVYAANINLPYEDDFEGPDPNWSIIQGSVDLNNTDWSYRGSESAFLQTPGGPDAFTYLTLNNTRATIFYQARVRVSKTPVARFDHYSTLGLSGAGGLADNPLRLLIYNNGTDIITACDERIAGVGWTNGTTIIQANVTYVFELYFDASNNTGRWWIDGVSQGFRGMNNANITHMVLGGTPSDVGRWWADDVIVNTTYIGFVPNDPPNVPIIDNPLDEQRFSPVVGIDFEWTFDDPDVGNTQGAYEVEVSTVPGFGTTVHDTGKVNSANEYYNWTTPTLVDIYYWRVRTWDNLDVGGDWNASESFFVDQMQLFNLTAADNNITVGSTAVLNVDGFHRFVNTEVVNATYYDNFENFNVSGAWTQRAANSVNINTSTARMWEGDTSMEIWRGNAIERDVTNDENAQVPVYMWSYFMTPSFANNNSGAASGQGIMELRSSAANVINVVAIHSTDSGATYDFRLSAFNMTPGFHLLGPSNTSALQVEVNRWYKVVTLYENNATHTNNTLWVDDVEVASVLNVPYSWNYTANNLNVGAQKAANQLFNFTSFVDAVSLSYNYPTNVFPGWGGVATYNDTLTQPIAGNYTYTVSSITDVDYGITDFTLRDGDTWVNFYGLPPPGPPPAGDEWQWSLENLISIIPLMVVIFFLGGVQLGLTDNIPFILVIATAIFGAIVWIARVNGWL